MSVIFTCFSPLRKLAQSRQDTLDRLARILNMLLRQPLLRRAALLASGSALLSRQLTLLDAPAPSDASLGSLWGTALDGMMDVPGAEALSSAEGVLYLTPASGSEAPTPAAKWPRLFSKGVVYSLTAQNPMGVTAPAAWNKVANEALEDDLHAIKVPYAPRCFWRSFGFNAQEGWREEGFSVAFAREERAFARVHMLRLAQKYSQAAIYAYGVEDGVVVREVVWADQSKQATHGSKEPMAIVAAAPKTPLAARGWEAPPDGPDVEVPRSSPKGVVAPSVWDSPFKPR